MAKGWEIFSHAIQVEPTIGFGCGECPEELKPGEKEEDFEDEVEVHTGDGLNMGMIMDHVKDWNQEDLFGEERVEGRIVRGIEAVDRTILSVDRYFSCRYQVSVSLRSD